MTGFVRIGTTVEASDLSLPCTQRDNGMTTGRVECTGDEIGLPAEARVDPPVNEAGVGLGEQVDLHSRVDRQHGTGSLQIREGSLIVSVRTCGASVAVSPFVELGRADQERRDESVGRRQGTLIGRGQGRHR